MYLCSRYNIKTICMSISRFNAVEKASNRKAVEAITPNQKVSEYYGENVFNRKAMQKYLSKETYKALTHAIDNGTPIDREIANHVAAGMRMWALEKGVTHYTHWFQPLTDGTAEKHDAFVEHDGGGGSHNRSRTHPASPTADCATRSKPAAIRPGTPPHLRLS